MKNRKFVNIILIILPVAAVVLNALPNTVKMDWFGGYTTYSSGFSTLPIGYAIWGPMLAGVSAGVVGILGVYWAMKRNSKSMKWMTGLSAFAALMSLTPLMTGDLTVIGGAITVLMALETALLLYMKKVK